MPAYCVALGCKNIKNKESKQSFHRFPKDKQLRKQWEIAVKRQGLKKGQNWVSTKTSVLCSDHFDDECFDRTGQIVRLRANSVPSKFKHLGQKPPSRKPPHDRIPLVETIESTANIPDDNNINTHESQEPTISHVTTFHNYCLPSPRKLKRCNDHLIDIINKKNKKIKLLTSKTSRLESKISTISDALEDIKRKQMLSLERCDQLSDSFGSLPIKLSERATYNIDTPWNNPKRYDEDLKKFALTMHYFSPRAYTYLRKAFINSLPDVSTLRKWKENIDCEPGFSDPVLDALVKKISESSQDCVFNLTVDEMSIRKHLDLQSGKIIGYMDLGTGITGDSLPVAKEAWVFMVVGLNINLRVPFAYFLIAGLSAQERANLITECLIKLHQKQITVAGITFDGNAANFSMANLLGANLRLPNIKNDIVNPADLSQSVYILLDACHMIKLVRNTLGEWGILVDSDGEKIEWKYIEMLHAIQDKEGVKLANKLTRQHIEYHQQKMKVRLATQTLSSSVADALEYLCRIEKIEEFRDCMPTVQFLRLFDRLFDVLNSKNPYAKNFKAPMKKENEIIWRPFLLKCIQYISNLKEPRSSQPVCLSQRKTGFLGLLTTIESTIQIFDKYVKSPHAPLRTDQVEPIS